MPWTRWSAAEQPVREVRLELRERREPPAREGVALHVLHAGLGLALGASSVRPAGPRLDAPVAAERDVGRMEGHRLRGAVAAEHEAARVVAEHLGGHAAEVPERRRDPSRHSPCRSCRNAFTKSRRE